MDMYGIFTYIWLQCMVNVDKYTIYITWILFDLYKSSDCLADAKRCPSIPEFSPTGEALLAASMASLVAGRLFHGSLRVPPQCHPPEEIRPY